jgi:hypothetical protein
VVEKTSSEGAFDAERLMTTRLGATGPDRWARALELPPGRTWVMFVLFPRLGGLMDERKKAEREARLRALEHGRGQAIYLLLLVVLLTLASIFFLIGAVRNHRAIWVVAALWFALGAGGLGWVSWVTRFMLRRSDRSS